MTMQTHEWDFFLAHAGADLVVAEFLHGLLTPFAKTFLDSRCLLLGDNWDEELAKAQQKSLITVVFVSPNTSTAYYQREEIAAAIAMARRDKDKHRVIPIYLNGWPRDEDPIPYGLRLKHGLSIPECGGLRDVATRLLSLLAQLRGKPLERVPIDHSKPATVSIPQRNYSTAAIRRLLTEALTDDDLNSLCMDEFSRVFNQFSAGMTRAQKIQQLIEYCSRQNQFPKLLNCIRDINPDRFAELGISLMH